MKLTIVVFCTFLAYFSMAQNQGSGQYSFDLKQSVEYALQNNAKVQNADADEKIAKARIQEIIGIGLPQLNAGIDFKDFVQLPTSLIPGNFFPLPPGAPRPEFIEVAFGTKYNTTVSLDASQLIFDGSYLVGLQASRTYAELARKNTDRNRVETVAAVTKAYYSVLVNEEHAKLIDVNIDRIRKLLDDSRVMFENGFIEKIDIDRMSVTYNNLTSEKEKIGRLTALGYSLLKFQMGMDLAAELKLTDKLSEIDFGSVSAEGGAEYGKRAEYGLLQTQKKLNELDIRRHRMTYLPSLVAFGNLSAQAQRNEFNFFDTKRRWYPIGIVGAKLNIPVFDGFQKNYRIQQAKLTMLKTENEIKNLERGIDMEVQSARAAFLNSRNSLDVQKKNLDLAQNIYDVAKIKYEQGVGSNIEIINAESSLKETRINYYTALYEALVAKTDLERATGNLQK